MNASLLHSLGGGSNWVQSERIFVTTIFLNLFTCVRNKKNSGFWMLIKKAPSRKVYSSFLASRKDLLVGTSKTKFVSLYTHIVNPKSRYVLFFIIYTTENIHRCYKVTKIKNKENAKFRLIVETKFFLFLRNISAETRWIFNYMIWFFLRVFIQKIFSNYFIENKN